jgi:hypothetical protein
MQLNLCQIECYFHLWLSPARCDVKQWFDGPLSGSGNSSRTAEMNLVAAGSPTCCSICTRSWQAELRSSARDATSALVWTASVRLLGHPESGSGHARCLLDERLLAATCLRLPRLREGAARKARVRHRRGSGSEPLFDLSGSKPYP